jgi:hypothetical protein
MASLRIRLDCVTKALDNVVEAADEAIAACRAVPVPEDNPTLLDLVGVRERYARHADPSFDAVILPSSDSALALPCLRRSRSSITLLTLPREIRNKIYECLFASTRLLSSKVTTSFRQRKRLKPAPNSLAVLRTCRQVNNEARNIWLSLILFDFETVEDALDKLSRLPLNTISQIRHIRVSGHLLRFRSIHLSGDVFYRTVWALKLLPGLRLKRFTVLAPCKGGTAYETLDGLITDGTGWEELYFVTPNSNMLGFARFDTVIMDPFWRKPKPTTWNDILLVRNGANSGASVTIYRATQPGVSGAVLNHRTRQLLHQRPSREELESFGIEEDRELLSADEASKELLVVVKRGRHIDATEHDSIEYELEREIRLWTSRRWRENRSKRFEFAIDESEGKDDDEDEYGFTNEDGEDVEIDAYKDVDEFSWGTVF